MSKSSGVWRTGQKEARGFRQFYREWQPATESTLPVLALHGSLTQSGMWIALAEETASVRLLCPDQRGFGLSEDPSGDSCADFAGDALALADELLPGRFTIMGHSFACSIALEVARSASARVASVVLVDPVVRVNPPPHAPTLPKPNPESLASMEEAERHFREAEEGEWPDDSLPRFVRDVMMRDGGVVRFPYTNERLHRLRTFTVSAASDYDLFSKAKSVACPVLVLRGGMSKRFPAAGEHALCNAFPWPVQVVVCPRSGHFPSSTETALVSESLKTFLAGIS